MFRRTSALTAKVLKYVVACRLLKPLESFEKEEMCITLHEKQIEYNEGLNLAKIFF